jgi:hypothetical protein
MKSRMPLFFGLAFALGAGLCAEEPAKDGPKPEPAPPKGASKDERSGWPDSFKYYGPNGLWKTWNESQRLGRDTWIYWTGGNQKFLRLGTILGGQQQVPISIEYFRLLDSRHRGDRFKKLGLMNEPNCVAATKPDENGLWLDEWKGDPENYYPTKYYPGYEKANGVPPYAPTGEEVYGEPTGVVGLRKFKNPKFDKSKWDVKKYFDAPWAMEPPYHVGFSCAFCHMSFDPTNPPKDPENPRWENLAANMGNQYFKEGDIFFGRGRFIFGDRNPLKGAKDPYDTKGLDDKSLLFHYAITQQPGTSETSRISYDFINNPNTINSIFYLGDRPKFAERSPDGKLRLVNHILKDGSDSVGVDMALLRVWVNIFCEGRYWIDDLYNPGTGRRQKPFDLNDLRLNARADDELSVADKARRDELRARYGPDVGKDWAEAHRRNPHLLGYLASYTPYHLKDAPGGKQFLLDETKPDDKSALDRGKKLFALHCAECHSNKQPMYSLVQNRKEKEHFFRDSVLSPGFLEHNTLSDDVRYRVTDVGTNMARALATNAVDGDIWAELSSKDYKALPPLGTLRLKYVFDDKSKLLPKPAGAKPDPKNDLTLDFTPPGGGRGYYRTPSLVSMWATAPYFHNNALGDYYVENTKTKKKFFFPNDGSDLYDKDLTPLTIDTSVEGRLKMFQDAAEKLLWPEKRHFYIKRTAKDCDIIDLKPVTDEVKDRLPELLPHLGEKIRPLLDGILSDLFLEYLQEAIAQEVKTTVPDSLRRGAILAEARRALEEVRSKPAPADLAGLKDRLTELAKDKLLAVVADAAGADLAAALKAKLAGLAAKFEAEAKELLELHVLGVPKGTPVNLYFNLGSGALPYAVKAQIKYRHDQRKLAAALLSLSDCPDLVEDKGHAYGADLTDAEKRDLIEFLKTL